MGKNNKNIWIIWYMQILYIGYYKNIMPGFRGAGRLITETRELWNPIITFIVLIYNRNIKKNLGLGISKIILIPKY